MAKCYGGSDYDGATHLIELSDGYLFAGYTHSYDGDVSGFHGNVDMWVVKVGFEGDIIWQNSLGGSEMEYPAKVFQNVDGSFTLFGETSSHDGDVTGNHSYLPDSDIWIVRLSSEGSFYGSNA